MADDAPKTVTVYHPDLDRKREVSEVKVDAWVAQGWRKTDPRKTTKK